MRQRNMWISEPGRERQPLQPAETEAPAQAEPKEETNPIPDPNHPLLKRGLPLDKIVPRTRQKWD